MLATASWFDRDFHLSDGVWIDSEYTPGDPVMEHATALAAPAELESFASLQKEMIVVAEGQAWRLRGPALPETAVLHQNTPNPFNAETTIRITVAGGFGPQPVRLEIYDLTGRRVLVEAWEGLVPGDHVYSWDGTDDDGRAVGTGVYLYRLVQPGHAAMRKMMLMK